MAEAKAFRTYNKEPEGEIALNGISRELANLTISPWLVLLRRQLSQLSMSGALIVQQKDHTTILKTYPQLPSAYARA